ncbi:GlpG protein [Aquipluma nitroreducens]|uniref:GlpG protein n=1 Tax=Aquipluma nitroreducens TaxID=2010828 RepID=A0A5K7SBS0_9BACT|nr:rhomboid family intramembrane serine protease [Aquipluma nitroreducens]BBE18935.1 GlpG protein [Aquipluma nitroreducens]
MTIFDEIKESFREGSALTRVIYINLGVFLVFRILNVFFFLSGTPFPLMDWLALPADFEQLASRPWTLITYMFLHFDFLHILFNLLWLYWMGQIFLTYFDQGKLITIYLLGGISGGLFYVAGYNLFPVFSHMVSDSRLLGASASVIAIVTALAVNAPNHTLHLMFIGPVKMKYIALVSVLMYVIGISSTNAGGNLAHLGGAFWGVIYVLQLRRGIDPGKSVNGLFSSLKKTFSPKPKVKVSYRKPVDDIEYNRQKNQDQKRMNEILEKISKSGYDSLSKEEKEILFRMGK